MAIEGVTTAIALFVLAALAWPNVIKNKPQYYFAFAALCLIILLTSLAGVIGGGFVKFAGFAIALLQVAALVLLVLAAGGLTVRDLLHDVADAYDAARNPDRDKPTLVPLTGEQPKPRRPRPQDEDAPRERIVLDDPTPPAPKPDNRGPLPLD